MSFLSKFLKTSAKVAPSVSQEIFDEQFQRKLEMLALVSKRAFAGRMRADRRTRKVGSGVEFADHREYRPGDDIRCLDWNVYQKFDKLVLRLFEEEEDLAVYLLLDISRSMGLHPSQTKMDTKQNFRSGPKLNYAKQLLAAIAYIALSNLDRVGISTLGRKVEGYLQPTRGKQRIYRIFDFLRPVSAEFGTCLEDALKQFVVQNPRKGLAVLFSDLYDPAGFERGINVLRYNKFEPYVIHILDSKESKPNLHGDVRVVDIETGDHQELTATSDFLAKYQRNYENHIKDIETFCLKKHVSYFQADVQVPFDTMILRIFRQGGFVR